MSRYIYLLVCPFFYYLPFSPTIALENNNYLTLILLPAKLSVLAILNFFETSFFGTPCPCFVHYFQCFFTVVPLTSLWLKTRPQLSNIKQTWLFVNKWFRQIDLKKKIVKDQLIMKWENLHASSMREKRKAYLLA